MSTLTSPTVRRRAAFALAAALPAIVIVVFLGGTGSHASAQPVARPSFPTATNFAVVLDGSTEQYAREHGDVARIAHANCVQGDPGDYMCSYTVEKPGAAPECHLMQARWAPGSVSSFTVTLAGRTHKCGSVREAIRTLD